MSFLQPTILLFGLPLVLVPVIIHLLNRMRYRTVPWAAMMFLLAASKQATRQARLREWLILACRVLAVLALLVFLSRPLVGGWLGWAAGNQPATVVVLLDRSPSMEAVEPQTRLSKRELALNRLAEAASEMRRGSRFILIDSATRQPQEVANLSVLKELSVAGPSDAAADIPSLLASAFEYLGENQSGRAEIWLCSDLQESNWQPGAPGWVSVQERFAALEQDVRIRLLALTQPVRDNVAARIIDLARQRTGTGYELTITVELTGQDAAAATFPLSIVHENARSQVEVNFGGQKLRTQCRLDLGARETSGWGWIELPADNNLRDNRAYFAYPEALRAKSVVVADSEPARRFLQLAAAPAPVLLNQVAVARDPGASLGLADAALLVWQSAAPTGQVETVVQEFLNQGGVVLYLPATEGDSGSYRVATWQNADGPLAKTKDGKDLPLPEVAFSRRAALSQEGNTLAMFADGKPFLTKMPVGRGAAYHCASLPLPEWSTLGEGTVLVPMVQRMVQEGVRRLGQAVEGDVGDRRFQRAENLSATETPGVVSAAAVAGIYQQDNKLIALNRAAREDDLVQLDEDAVRAVMGDLPYQMFEEKGNSTRPMQAEIWRWFLIAMLLFLTVESLFSLPTATQLKRWSVPGERVAFGQESTETEGRS